MDNSDIKNICIQIKEDAYQLTDKELKNKYHTFHQQYPSLFKACLNKDNSLEFLDYMLQMKEKVYNDKSISLDDADKEVYETVNAKFIYPFLSKDKTQ